MILGDVDSYMSTTDYVFEANKKDARYASYVAASIVFTNNIISDKLFVKATEMDADLIAVSLQYRVIQ